MLGSLFGFRDRGSGFDVRDFRLGLAVEGCWFCSIGARCRGFCWAGRRVVQTADMVFVDGSCKVVKPLSHFGLLHLLSASGTPSSSFWACPPAGATWR